ncbi:MAG: ribokinase [Anaerolineae bacterium]|nr:ribokinase [Anaerolineae bacterium]
MSDYHNLLPLIDRLSGHRLLVVGDVMLDEYLIGRTERLSREAPIPVLEFERRDLIPGGASNPAANIVSLGSAATQVGIVGNDDNGVLLHDLLKARGINPAGLVVDAGRPTTTKTRIMAQMGLRFPQQVARIDRIERHAINGSVEQAIISNLDVLTQDAQAILVSDYLNGMLTESVISAIRTISRDRHLLLTADAQGDLEKYSGFDLVKCNADEASRYAGRILKTDDDFALVGRIMVTRLNLWGGIMITRGPDGITLVQAAHDPIHTRSPHIEDVYDTVGAGDTVLAVVTLALVGGASFPSAAALANLAAGIVVRKVGNYAPSLDELRAALDGGETNPWSQE